MSLDNHSILREALRDLDQYFLGRLSDIKRGAETKAIAGLMFEKFAWGLSNGLKYVDHILSDGQSVSSAVQSKADELVIELDPDHHANKEKRWKSKPADLKFNIPKE